MKDLGIRQGSAAFAVPVVVMPDAVYVHKDIQKVEPQEGMENAGDVYVAVCVPVSRICI